MSHKQFKPPLNFKFSREDRMTHYDTRAVVGANEWRAGRCFRFDNLKIRRTVSKKAFEPSITMPFDIEWLKQDIASSKPQTPSNQVQTVPTSSGRR
jgi:hypothetical protein